MQNTPPEVGKTYQSAEPTLTIYVENVEKIEAEAEYAATFFVEGCEANDEGDINAIGYEFTEEEWLEHGFLLIDRTGSDQ